jgi:hypothetical protein
MIEGFEPEDDSLLLVWDDRGVDDEEPEVSVDPDPEQLDQTLVRMNGVIVASVKSADVLTAADVSIVPLSSAIAAGLALS